MRKRKTKVTTEEEKKGQGSTKRERKGRERRAILGERASSMAFMSPI